MSRQKVQVQTIKQVINRLKKYELNSKIAVNWWLEDDFQDGYDDVNKALELAQDYLDTLNPALVEYVDMNI